MLTIVFLIGLVSSLPIQEQDPAYPEENPGLFEGDIELQPGQDPTGASKLRNAVVDHRLLWPKGVVPFQIDSYHKSRSTHVSLFQSAMQEIMDKTMVNGKKCIDFQPRTNETAYIQFTYGSGCHTPVGYHGRESDVTLGNGCLRKGTVLHEILHALGFWHEVNRPDRDNYIIIHWENLPKGYEHSFQKYKEGVTIDSLNMPFDYESVMNYIPFAFGIDRRKPTVEPIQPGVTIGQRLKLSDGDAKEIQILYGCIPRPPSLTGSGAHTGTQVTSAPQISQTSPSHNGTSQANTCTFDHGLCDWTQENTDNLDWTARHGETPSAHTGPHTDHTGSSLGMKYLRSTTSAAVLSQDCSTEGDTTGKTNYLYMEATGHFNRTAKLLSPTYNPGLYCFTAYFHMYGAQTGYLSFNLVQHGHAYHMKTYQGNHGDRWLGLHLSVNVRSTTFHFEIEGHTGQGYKSDIAIDDLSVTPGHC